MTETITLYRPIGPAELAFLKETNFTRWPPRLPEQPIFYPVTNERYAREIAKRWNVSDSKQGFLTRFSVKKSFMDQYDIHQVGASYHTEWWIPADELETLNNHIIGKIEIIAQYPEEYS
jgi:hypothetical protein